MKPHESVLGTGKVFVRCIQLLQFACGGCAACCVAISAMACVRAVLLTVWLTPALCLLMINSFQHWSACAFAGTCKHA